MPGPVRCLPSLSLLVFFLVFPLRSMAGDAVKEPEIFPLSDVRPGQEGWGETVIEGTETLRFQMKVLGVLRRQSPGRDAILVRLSGAGLERTRIIAGMSGSPVWIDGKLLGAVAFSWAFAKDAVGGVTPIEAMLDEARRREPTSARRSHGLLPPEEAPPPEGGGLRRALTPLVLSGFGARAVARLEKDFAGLGFLPVAGGGGAGDGTEAGLGRPLRGGDAMGLRLVRGDWNVTAIGTVTAVVGKKVLGFGHPFMGGGWWSAPLCSARVHTILANDQLSFKIASPLEDLGRLVLDRPAGVVAILGEQAPMCPVSITVEQGETGRSVHYAVEVVDHPQLTPRLLVAVLGNALGEGQSALGPLTVDMDMELHLRGERPLSLKESWVSQGGGAAAPPLVEGLMSLLQNSFRPVRLRSLKLRLRCRPGMDMAELIDAWSLRDEFRAGEELRLGLRFRRYDGSQEDRVVKLRLPAELEEGDLTLSLASGRELERPVPPPRDLGDMIRNLEQRHAPRDLVCRIPLSTEGLQRPGHRLPRLEGTRARLLAASGPGLSMGDTVDELRPMPWLFTGRQSLRIHVKKRRKP